MDRSAILFIYGAHSCVPLDPLKAAKRMGLTTVLASTERPCEADEALLDAFIAVDLADLRKSSAFLEQEARRYNIGAVIPYDDVAVPAAALLVEALGLPGNGREAARRSRSKLAMKEAFVAGGVPCARFRTASTAEEAQAGADVLGYPVVLKPLFGAASQAVIKVSDPAQVQATFQRVRGIIEKDHLYVPGDPDADKVLIEEYLPGDEYTVELLIAAGQTQPVLIFDKPDPLTGPFFEETIYLTPSRASRELQEEMQQVAICGVKALGLVNGPAHCEVRVTPQGPKLLEIGARAVGGICARTFTYARGADFHEDIIRVALGQPPRLLQQPEPPAALSSGVLMLPIPRTGMLRSIHGVEEARQIPGIREVIIQVEPGEFIYAFPEQSCYVGFALAAAPTPEEVEAALRQASATIILDIAELPKVRGKTLSLGSMQRANAPTSPDSPLESEEFPERFL